MFSYINLIFHSAISFPGVLARSATRNQVRPTSIENSQASSKLSILRERCGKKRFLSYKFLDILLTLKTEAI